MKKLLKWFLSGKNKKRRTVEFWPDWMKEQLVQMGKMNQGIVSMSLSKD